tara:strand:+ start:444 stop:1292 length:849 start_codon:yes stop_codon:yes gene_type:complete
MNQKKRFFYNAYLENLYAPIMRFLIIIKPLFVLFGIFYSIKNPNDAIVMWTLSLIVCFFMIVLGTDIGLHRYDAHKSFKTSKAKRIFLLFWSIPCMSGSPLHWAVVHRKHHAECDSENDPHSPHSIPWWKVWFYLHPAYEFVPLENKKYFKGLISDKVYQLTHAYYFLLVSLYLFSLWYFFGFEWLLFGMLIPSAIVDCQMAFVNVVCHMYGYENYKTGKQCHSKNNWLVHFLTFFSFGLHNNHHWDPGNHRTSKKKGEVDLSAWIIEVFFLDKSRKIDSTR